MEELNQMLQKKVKEEDCDIGYNEEIFWLPIELYQMVQIQKLGDPNEKDKHKLDLEDPNNRAMHNIQGSQKYFFLNRRNIRKIKYSETGFGSQNEIFRQGMKCYISCDLNNLIIGGLNLGTERFGLPYDYFRRAMFVFDKQNRPHVIFNMKFREEYLYFAQMFYLKQVSKESSCRPKARINYDLMMKEAQNRACIFDKVFKTAMVRSAARTSTTCFTR